MKIMAMALTAVSLLLTTAGFTIQNEPPAVSSILDQVIDGKYYVTPGTVYVAPEGIYVYLAGELISVSSLGVDSNGVYVSATEILTPKRMWECRRCYKYNWESNRYCMKCGLPRGEIDD